MLYSLIQRTSVMTLSVAGIFKEIATILLSSSVFGDELTPINVTGLCIALTGIGMYNYLKYTLLIRNNNNNLEQQGHAHGQTYTHRRLQDEEDRCTTEMGGTILPTLAKKGSQNRREENVQEDSLGEVHLSGEDLDKRRKREEEADMVGWNSSGIIRTGNGNYDDDDSNCNDSKL